MHDDIRTLTPPGQQHTHKEKVTEPEKFLTPDEAATHDILPPPEELVHPSAEPEPIKTKPMKKHKFWPLTKKQWLIGGTSLIALLLIAGGIWMLASHKSQPLTENIPRKVLPKPPVASNTVPSTLTGLPVNPSANQRPITAVMIENTPAARPQSGLSQAGVVIEALTEGGITRFEAFYQDQLASNVGPIRSARPYYLDWALGFDAPYAHVGGSPTALAEIPQLGVKNLDYMYYPNTYTRISSRPAPHNVYTSISRLIALEKSNGWTSSSFSGWPRKPDSPSKNPTAANITFNISYSTYNVNYSYDSQTNSYNRSEGGAPQIDANTNKQLSPKVVIGMIVPWSQGPLDSSDAYYSVYQTVGS